MTGAEATDVLIVNTYDAADEPGDEPTDALGDEPGELPSTGVQARTGLLAAGLLLVAGAAVVMRRRFGSR